jgi:hypothetical protein
MALNKGKHIVEPINGERCSVVEKNIDKKRADFLKKLLEHNGYKVQVAIVPTEVPPTVEGSGATLATNAPEMFVLGVTDLLFNPVVDIYKRRLKSFTGHKVTPAYWLQLSDKETEAEVNYYAFNG